MSSFFSIFLLLSALSTNAFAQNSTTLPFAACLLPCDTAALAAVNCTSSDTLCHCHNAPATFAILVPCVLSNSTCGSAGEADLISFGNFAAGTCVPFNLTVPDIADFFPANGTVNTTLSPKPSPTPSPQTGGAIASRRADIWMALVGAVGLAFIL